MTIAHLQSFMQDLRGINPDIRIGGGWFKIASSVTGLVNHLQTTAGAPAPLTIDQAIRLNANPASNRLVKYRPAIERLCQVWGRGAHRNYPPVGSPTTTALARTRARDRFAVLRMNFPLAHRPDFDMLGDNDMNVFAFSIRNAPTAYIARVAILGNTVDITARSLFLAAGLVPEQAHGANPGYAEMLGLSPVDLQNMAGRSILDVACGGAMFGAEMNALYGCPFDCVDLNAAHVPAAMNAAKTRYAASMMYLQMLADENMLGLTNIAPDCAPVLEDCVMSGSAIFHAYDNNPPVAGDAFNLTPTRNARRATGWDYVVSTYFFCYLDRTQQTNALLEMCGVANRKVIVYCGVRLGLGRLDYDWTRIVAAFPNARRDADTTDMRIGIDL